MVLAKLLLFQMLVRGDATSAAITWPAARLKFANFTIVITLSELINYAIKVPFVPTGLELASNSFSDGVRSGVGCGNNFCLHILYGEGKS